MSMGDGRGVDVAELADLLREAEQHHGAFEASAPKHSWADRYAPNIRARFDGNTSDKAVESADQYVKDNFNVVRRERHPVLVGDDGPRAAVADAVHL